MEDRESTELELKARDMTDEELASAIRKRLVEVHYLAKETRTKTRRLKIEFNKDSWGHPWVSITKTL